MSLSHWFSLCSGLVFVSSVAHAKVTFALKTDPATTAAFIQYSKDLSLSEWRAAWDAWESQSSDMQFIYDNLSFRKGTQGWEKRREEKLKGLYEVWPRLSAQMLELNRRASSELTRLTPAFAQLFPAAELEVAVYALPSGMSYNGKVANGKNAQPVLLLGLDLLASRGDNLALVAAHELFHVFHLESMGADASDAGLYLNLWMEGLATYASGLMVPADEAGVLMDDELARHCQNPKTVAVWAKQFLIESAMAHDDAAREAMYKSWFLISAEATPQRRGYCLGYKIASALASQIPLAELPRWHHDKIDEEMRKSLAEMAGRSIGSPGD